MNGVELHRAAPTTFEIPTEERRSRLVPESDAKLVFRMRAADDRVVVERMWVRVTGYTEDAYEGVLMNDPVSQGVLLRFGDRVVFGPDHVIDALPPENWNPQTGQYERTSAMPHPPARG